jgi:hypothetical protein
MNFSKQDLKEVFETSITWLVVFAMLLYGMGKYVQFDGAEFDKLVSEMTGMELMWTFYGYSRPYVLIIGFFEVLGGILIFFKRTRIIGALLTSSILVNIILQDIFYQVNLGALRAAIIYQLMLLIVLWMNREKLVSGIKLITQVVRIDQPRKKFFLKLLIAFILFACLRALEYHICAFTFG